MGFPGFSFLCVLPEAQEIRSWVQNKATIATVVKENLDFMAPS
jgi:hypothetical protein